MGFESYSLLVVLTSCLLSCRQNNAATRIDVGIKCDSSTVETEKLLFSSVSRISGQDSICVERMDI